MTRGDAYTSTVESDHPQSNTTPPEFVIAAVELITRQSVGPPSCPDFVIEDVAVQDGLTGVVGELHPDDDLSLGGNVGDLLQVVGLVRLAVGAHHVEMVCVDMR